MGPRTMKRRPGVLTVGAVVLGVLATGCGGASAAASGSSHTIGTGTHITGNHVRRQGHKPDSASSAGSSASTTTFSTGNVQYCAVFTQAQQSAILGTALTGAKATLGLGDYDCNYVGGPANKNQVLANIDLQCNKTNAASGWQLYTSEGQGQPLPGDKFHVRQARDSNGRQLAAMLPDHCFLQADIGVSLAGKPNFKGAGPLRAAMDQAVQANLSVK